MITTQIDRGDIEYLVRNLEDFQKNKAVKSGLKSALNVFRVRGISNLRSRNKRHTGHLANSFTTKVKRNSLGGLAGFDRPGGNHSHLVDNGTVRRKTEKGYNRGVMPGSRFWSDAKVSEEASAARKLKEGIEKAVERINNRS